MHAGKGVAGTSNKRVGAKWTGGVGCGLQLTAHVDVDFNEERNLQAEDVGTFASPQIQCASAVEPREEEEVGGIGEGRGGGSERWGRGGRG